MDHEGHIVGARIQLTVYVDLDPMLGEFHTKENAVKVVEQILNDRISHYNPKAYIAKKK